ncbi:MAG: C25 family cysteine peptidase [Desulfobacterales bacterium]
MNNDLFDRLRRVVTGFSIRLSARGGGLLAGLLGAFLFSAFGVPAHSATLEVSISNTGDDATQSTLTLPAITTGSTVAVYSNTNPGITNYKSGGLRFQSITIPQGAKINSATLRLYMIAGYGNLNCLIYGHAADDAPGFSTSPYNTITNTTYRPRTSAYTAEYQTGLPAGWHTIDVSAVVQEIVNRPGWSSGNALALLFIPNTDSVLFGQFYDYSGSSTYAAKLSIDYSPFREVYYSIGTSTADLKTGSPTISIVNGTATLSVAQTGNIGVGDVITYNTSSKVYIKSVTSQTTFGVTTATGDTPGNVSNAAVNSIQRVFNNIATAVSSSSNASYLNTSDLVSNNAALTWVLYNDGPFSVSSPINISGWTTGANNFLTFTAAGSSQVASGVTQRHNGIAGAGVMIEAGSGVTLFSVAQRYTRIEWLEIDGNGLASTTGIHTSGSGSYALFRNLIIHHVTDGIFTQSTSGNEEIRNCFVYKYAEDAIRVASPGVKVYNCSLYDSTGTGEGVQVESSGSATVKNVIAMDNSPDFFSAGTLSLSHCMSSDASAGNYGGTGNLTNQSALYQFVSISGTIDLHLKNGSNAINAGQDLSSLFTDDIDGSTRSGGWDMGADESSRAAPLKPLVLYTEKDSSTDDLVRYSTYAGGWESEATAFDSNDAEALVWHVAQAGPNGREYVVLASGRTSTTLYASLYNGSAWSGGDAGTYKNLGGTQTTDQRPFHAAYEMASGRLLIVKGTPASAQITYWLWDGSSWVVNGQTYDFSTLSRSLYWVQMASRPGANQIALVGIDQLNNVVALIWDGDARSWGNEKLLGTATHYDGAVIDVEYMQAGTNAGKALFAWGSGTTLYSWTWSGTAWEGSAKSKTGFGGDIRWVVLAANPGDDTMLAGVEHANSNGLQTVNWTGSSWGTIQTVDTLNGSYADNRPFDIIFESASGHSGHALLVYSDSGSGNGLRYRHTSNIGGAWEAEASVDLVNPSDIDCYWVELARTREGTIHLACQDHVGTTQDQLLAYTWDHSAWGASASLEGNLYYGPINRSHKAFAVAAQPPQAPVVLSQVHYRWRNDDGLEQATTDTLSLNSSGYNSYSSGSSISLTTTVNAGADRVMVVAVSFARSTTTFPLPTVSSISLNGSAMTSVVSANNSSYASASLYYLVNPPTGNPVLSITLSSSLYGASDYVEAVVGYVVYNGADPSNPVRDSSSATGLDASPTVTVASAPGDWVIGAAQTRLGTAISFSTVGGTSRWSVNASPSRRGAGGDMPADSTSETHTWSMGGSQYWAAVAASIKPNSDAAATFALAEDSKLGVAKSTRMRLRFLVSNSGTGTSSAAYKLQVAETASCASGSYGDVPTASTGHWQIVDSPYFTDGAVTANLASGLTDPAGGAFTAGQLKDAGNTTGSLDLDADEFTEIEFALQATSNATSGGDYCFRLYNAAAGGALNNYETYAQARVLGVTAIRLLSFAARGEEGGVRLRWQTGQEAENRGFNLYRGAGPAGPWEKLNSRLIPSASVAGEGRGYEFLDTGVARGRIVYFLLEDVDASGTHTPHGPVCVDWDGDGLPDDWEVAHGFDPARNDADLDPDGDGLANRLEWARGTDPRNRDSDGDGVPDGEERKSPSSGDRERGPASLFGTGVTLLAADPGGMTLELLTPACDVTPVSVNGEIFERLRLPGLVHGFTLEPGRPQLPVKGLFVALPAGKTARLEVLETRTRRLPGFRVYPAPSFREEGTGGLAEVFRWDEAFYGRDLLYPEKEVELAAAYVSGGTTRQGIRFQPLQFNPATGELLHHERIRVRVHFVEPPVAAPAARSAASLSPPRVPAAAVSGWRPPAGAAYKLKAEGEGIYRLTRADLLARGLSAGEIDALDLEGIQLFHEGVEQPLFIRDANGNGRLDAEDRIVFYAAPVPAAHAKYSKTAVYWLVDSRDPAARRMAVVDGTPAGGPLAATHRDRLIHERDEVYYPQAAGGHELDRWIFATLPLGAGYAGGGGWADYGFRLADAAGGGAIRLRLYSPYDLEHRVAVRLNGVELGTALWNGLSWHEASFDAPSLVDGENTISLRCEVELDKIAVDRFVVDHDRAFAADGDRLRFTHEAGHRFRVTGFSESEIELYDITAPVEVRRIVGAAVSGSGPFFVEFEAPGEGERRYVVLTSSALRAPSAVERDRPSALSTAENGADWILLTQRSLGWQEGGRRREWVDRLVALREAGGLRTAVVDVEDVFDEFAFGYPAPGAIRDFLAFARANWPPPAPRFLLLAGDASYDFKDNWNFGTACLLPAPLRYTRHFGETAADDAYGRPEGEGGLSELAIGRLPAADPDQAAAMAEKIIAYETAANSKSWERRVLLVADDIDSAWEAVFETMNEDLAALLPGGFSTPGRFYLQEYEDESLAVSDLTADLLAAVDAGALLVNYAGHGQQAIWAGERILDNRGADYRADLADLANAGRLPFVVNLSCLTGYFLYPEGGWFAADAWRSLAEGWLRPTATGAIAALMPTGMTDTVGQQLLGHALYEAIFLLDRRTLGEAVSYAKEQLLANGGSAYEETADTFLLFGDPALTLKVPLPRRPAAPAVERAGDGTVLLSWPASLDADGRPVAGYRVFRRGERETSWTRLTPEPVDALSYPDAGLAGAAPGALFFYALTAVDADGDESVLSESASLRIADASGGGGSGGGKGGVDGGGGGGCFLDTASPGVAGELLGPLATLALLVFLLWIGGNRRGKIGSDHADDGPMVRTQRGFRLSGDRRRDDPRPHPP